ncbi:MAG: hypothetical protein JNK79_08765 [Chitinophagaceae bacterium]|nr:hypothetical protein [Chitinophagaceae bacterium]
MKTVMLYACVLIFLTSCQKEIFLPETVKEGPKEIKIPDLQLNPKPEPEPAPGQPDPLDPPPGEVSESVYLSNLVEVLNEESHYRISRVFTDKMNLWLKTPEWSKDDVHTFGFMGSGKIESKGAAFPDNPFTVLEQNWTAYADADGVKLTWVDAKYNPVTYTLVYAVPGKCFKAFRTISGEKTYFMFEII